MLMQCCRARVSGSSEARCKYWGWADGRVGAVQGTALGTSRPVQVPALPVRARLNVPPSSGVDSKKSVRRICHSAAGAVGTYNFITRPTGQDARRGLASSTQALFVSVPFAVRTCSVPRYHTQDGRVQTGGHGRGGSCPALFLAASAANHSRPRPNILAQQKLPRPDKVKRAAANRTANVPVDDGGQDHVLSAPRAVVTVLLCKVQLSPP